MLEEVAPATSGSPKDERVLKKWINKLADPFEKLVGKTVEMLSAIVGSVVVAILSFLGKAVAFVPEPTWELIAFVAGFILLWLMEKVNRDITFFMTPVFMKFYTLAHHHSSSLSSIVDPNFALAFLFSFLPDTLQSIFIKTPTILVGPRATLVLMKL